MICVFTLYISNCWMYHIGTLSEGKRSSGNVYIVLYKISLRSPPPPHELPLLLLLREFVVLVFGDDRRVGVQHRLEAVFREGYVLARLWKTNSKHAHTNTYTICISVERGSWNVRALIMRSILSVLWPSTKFLTKKIPRRMYTLAYSWCPWYRMLQKL